MSYPSNTTALAEHELKLTCAVSGATQVRVNWQILERKLLRQKNLQRTGRNYRIVRDGPNRQQARLEFSRLLVSDSGYYRCVAKANGQTIQTDYFYLTIQGKYGHITLVLYCQYFKNICHSRPHTGVGCSNIT